MEWISTKDKLPEHDIFVLVVINGTYGNITFENAIELAEYYEDGSWGVQGYLDAETIEADYWMPLPEPPEGIEIAEKGLNQEVDAVKVVRCKNCKHSTWEMEPCHGKTEYFCRKLDKEVDKYFYCGCGIPKSAE